MKVSVIVPVYGVEAYLDKCVASIVGQTYRNIEIFLIDDGSPDRCPEMCDAWGERDARIVVIHKENEGQGVARNFALDRATGDYVLFVDSDDEILPDMVEKLVEATEGGSIEIALCGYIVREYSRQISPLWYERQFSLSNSDLMREYLTAGRITSGPVCKLISMQLMKDIRFPPFRANEDAYIIHEILGKCELAAVIPYRGYVQNIREGSTENSGFGRHKMRALDCAYAIRNYVAENYPDYFSYVKMRVGSACLSLLKKIYISGTPSAFSDCEERLAEILNEELETIQGEERLFREAILYLNHRSKYARKVKYHHFKARVKTAVKRTLSRLRRLRFV